MFRQLGGCVKFTTVIGTGGRDEPAQAAEMRTQLDGLGLPRDPAVADPDCRTIARVFLDMLQPSETRANRLLTPHSIGTSRP